MSKQLSKADEFYRELYEFHDKRGTHIQKLPIMNRQELNMFLLFQIVQGYGGFHEVNNNKLWKQVLADLIGHVNQSAPSILARHYERYLYPFERVKVNFLPDILSPDVDITTLPDDSGAHFSLMSFLDQFDPASNQTILNFQSAALPKDSQPQPLNLGSSNSLQIGLSNVFRLHDASSLV